MPLAKYFGVVGGVLLALLLVSNAFFASLPVAEKSEGERPVIRIHSDRKWPERIVFDTSIATIVPPATAQVQAAVPSELPPANAAGKGRPQDAFALLAPKDANQPPSTHLKKADPKPQP